MSFEVYVTVRRGLSLDEINEALGALEAPFAIGELRLDAGADGAQPDWSKPFEGGTHQAFPLLPELSFHPIADAGVDFDGDDYTLTTGSAELQPEVALAVALAMARCSGKATILLGKTGEELRGKLTKLEREVRAQLARQWEDLQRQAASVPEEVAAYRRPRPDDTAWTHYERVALREQPESAVARYLRERAGRAIADGRDAEIDRLLAAAPPGPALLEPLLDACSRGNRADLGRRVLAALRPHARGHLLAAVAYVGFRAAPYVQFVASLGAIDLDAELLAEARRRTRDRDMLAVLDGLASAPAAG